ncbi:MAG: DUF2723 domain-containing protein [Bacteroidaceae bacterium]|nr:DUF2723 domain-containing protein [Bacteroidaceae bacterium]
MKQYNLLNNVLGWVVFAIAAITYCSTVEPSASFWDCPEFIATAYKLEVGHPPGAPFFMLTGNLFSLFASDPSQVALMVNIMSALLSALCILFLFWTITALARKLIVTDNGSEVSLPQTLLVMGCGLTGALAYAWSDTFWFSAVEGEVYAYSSMFTALVFWLILKWEVRADQPGSDRWLVLIFYLTGLSIGVHLLNLLCLPAITLVYYYKKNPQANLWGSLIALAVSFVLIAAVLYGVVPGIVKVGGWFELFFVNTLGMGFNSGLVVYIFVLVGVVLAAIWSTTKSNRTLINALFLVSVALLGIPFVGHGFTSLFIGVVVLVALYFLLQFKRGKDFLLRKRALNTSLLCMLMLMIGYSTYALIVIRSTANPPMDQDSPEDVFTLGEYLGREQYGDTPLFYGEAYTSQPIDMSKKARVQRHEKKDASEPDRYDEVEITDGYVYPSAMKMLFPRMHSPLHAKAYEQWLGGVDLRLVDGEWEGRYFQGEMPSQTDNLRFFMSYQINFMYWRYFMWNFAGRQNDVQGFGEKEHGNWITGISFIDNALYGDQSLLPDDLKNNKGHNVFYCLPLLLGLIGLFWQAYKGKPGIQQFWVVFFLFFMTGLAIVLYLNQKPQEPRERDYAYAGSFYAFAIWIGLGVAGIAALLRKFLKNDIAAACIAGTLGVLVPLQMVSQTWDDHDRSGRFACRDFGMNYLSSLPEKGEPIIYTNGDNDTFPLWYAQEVEGFRTDARVCNLSYLQTSWYTDQMVRPAYDSPSLPIDWEPYQYVDNMGYDYFVVRPEYRRELDEIKAKDPSVNPYSLLYIIDNYVRPGKIREGEHIIIPTDSVVVPVNKQNVIASGMTLPAGPDSIPDYITISWAGKRGITKSQMMVYEMLARNDWKRPIFMSVTLGQDNYAGLQKYLALEGLAYRITPFIWDQQADVDKMYDNMMNRFRWGNVSWEGIYLDETNMRMCRTHRHMMGLLAKSLMARGDQKRAAAVLAKAKKELPFSTVPVDVSDLDLADIWLKLGDKKDAAMLYAAIARQSMAKLRWMNSFSEDYIYGNLGEQCYRELQITSMALEGLADCDAKQYEQLERDFTALSESTAGRSGFEVIQQQMRQQQPQAAPETGTSPFGF